MSLASYVSKPYTASSVCIASESKVHPYTYLM